jgi:hypothetical protein
MLQFHNRGKEEWTEQSLLEMAQNAFSLGLWISTSTTVKGFSVPLTWILCLLTYPDK